MHLRCHCGGVEWEQQRVAEALPRPDLSSIARQVAFEEWERLLQGESPTTSFSWICARGILFTVSVCTSYDQVYDQVMLYVTSSAPSIRCLNQGSGRTVGYLQMDQLSLRHNRLKFIETSGE